MERKGLDRIISIFTNGLSGQDNTCHFHNYHSLTLGATSSKKIIIKVVVL